MYEQAYSAKTRSIRHIPFRLGVVLGLCLSIVLGGAPIAVVAQDDSRTFPETGYTVSGEFLAYWNMHGGLPVFGYPISTVENITDPSSGASRSAQWFERNRFELHGENIAPYHVLLGRLGADALRQQGRDWQTFPKAVASDPHYFAETGHAIAHAPFWSYWSSHGLEFDGRGGKSFEESLALFGFPLSEPILETNSSGDRVLTQWFERARFEDHGAKGVLLGLLGNEVLAAEEPSGPVTQIVDGDTGFLLGGASDGLWVDPGHVVRVFRRDIAYRLFTLGGAAGQTTGGAVASAGVPCEVTQVVELAPEPAADTIGLNADWNPRPRGATALSLDLPVYRDAVADILRANGISDPDVRLTQVLRVDLEGDGVDEVLLTATRMVENGPQPNHQPGDYSLVALRQVVNEAVQTTLLDAEFYPGPSEFSAPSEFLVSNLLDLNGDGRLEVVMDWDYYEGAGTVVYDITGTSVRAVLGAGCGA